MNTLMALALMTGPSGIGQPPLPPPPTELLLPETSPPKAGPRIPGPTLPPPPPAVIGPIKPRVPTMDEFVRDFRPVPGVHEVTILHPISGKPVDLAFRLPEGNPKVRTGMRSITFSYPKRDVVLMFRIFNRADVQYD